MMQLVLTFLIAALVFGVCRLIDVGFTKLFRSKAQHMSGLAVRASKRYGVFGVALAVIGAIGITFDFSDLPMCIGGVIVLLMGLGLAAYYLTFGVFYDGESFLYSRLGKKDETHLFQDIVGQKLYLVQGGTVIVELHMTDGSVLSLQSSMDGVYSFLDTAFAAWCMQTGTDPQSCSFHDPSQSLWFPTIGETPPENP